MHRDLKPENCLLFQERRNYKVLRISDLGSSTSFAMSLVQGHTRGMCTLLYRGPELLMGLDYDQRMDIWSAGCIFYELLVGRPPVALGRIGSDSQMIENIANFSCR